jgi:hypothetical protein
VIEPAEEFMPDRYRAALALTSLLLLAAASGHHRHAHAKRPAFAQPPAGIELYSRRALRRARIILQLKLLDLRLQQLDRVRRAVERHIPVDRLLNQTASPHP